MENIILVTGHNHFASGILSSLEMIVGKSDKVFAIDFEKEDSDEILEEKIEKFISGNSNKNILFCCDLMGGTPFKVCAKFSTDNESFETVTGINLGGLINSTLKLNILDIKSLAVETVENSKKAVMLYEIVQNKTDEESSVGI